MRINRFWRFGKWLPVIRAMRPMLAELSANPDSGFLGAEYLLRGPRTVMLLQYWRDFSTVWKPMRVIAIGRIGRPGPPSTRPSALMARWAFSMKPTSFRQAGTKPSNANMPPFGLGKVAGTIPATGSRNEARSRLKAAVSDD